MKTKTQKTNTKRASPQRRPKKSVGSRHFIIWPALLALAILVVAYQVVRANDDNGLPLTASPGSISREAQLDRLEQQRQADIDAAYVSQQTDNAQGDLAGLNSVNGVIDDASR